MQSSSVLTLFTLFAFACAIGADALSSKEGLYSIPLTRQLVPIYKGERFIGNKTSYYGTIQVGSERKQFAVVFDTGSGHVVIPSVDCESNACTLHNQYNRNESASASDIQTKSGEYGEVRTGITATVTFGTGEITADFVHDKVCLNDIDQDGTSLDIFSAVEMTDDPFALFHFDGVFGLGLKPLAVHEGFHFIDQLTQAHAHSKQQFAVFMAHDDAEESQITFGGYEDEKALTPMQWVPLARDDLGYWQVPIKRVRVGDSFLPLCEAGDCYAIVDSGNSMLGVPKPQVTELHKLLARLIPQEILDQHENPTDIDCRNVPSPKLSFDLGDFEVELTHEELSKPQVWNVTRTYEEDGQNVTSSAMWCRHMLLPVKLHEPVGGKTFVFGEPFLRRYYTVFDAGEKKIGFALSNHNGNIQTV